MTRIISTTQWDESKQTRWVFSIIDLFFQLLLKIMTRNSNTFCHYALCGTLRDFNCHLSKKNNHKNERFLTKKKKENTSQSEGTWHDNLLFIEETHLRKMAKCLTSRLLSVMSSFSDELKHLTQNFKFFSSLFVVVLKAHRAVVT